MNAILISLLILWSIVGTGLFVASQGEFFGDMNKKQMAFASFLLGPVIFIGFLVWLVFYLLGDKKDKLG